VPVPIDFKTGIASFLSGWNAIGEGLRMVVLGNVDFTTI